MAAPITWRNVQGGSDHTASRLMDQAGQSFNRMFDGLGDVLDQKNQQLQNRDTEAFKQLLVQNYGNDPLALAEAQKTGEIDGLRNQFRYLDTAQTGTDAIADMVSNLQQRELQNQEYLDNRQQVSNRDARTQALLDIASGNLEQAEQAISTNQWVDSSDLIAALSDARRHQEDITHRDRAFQLQLNADKREAERQGWSREEQEYKRKQRELAKEREDRLNAVYFQAIQPLQPGETHTMRKEALRTLLHSDEFRFMAPGERTQLMQKAEEALTFGEAVANGDKDRIERILKPKEQALQRNVFYTAQNRTEDNGVIAGRLLESVSAKHEKSGLKQILVKSNANERLAIQQDVQNALSGLRTDGTRFHDGPVPESYVRIALNSVKGEGYTNWDRSFNKQLDKIVSSGAFLREYEDFANKLDEYEQLQNQTVAAARDGSILPQPQTQATAPNSEAERKLQEQIRSDISIPQPQNQTQSDGLPTGSGQPAATEPVASRFPEPEPRTDVDPLLPNGFNPNLNMSDTPNPVPEPEYRDVGEFGLDTPMRETISSAFNALSNAITRLQYRNETNNYEKITNLLERGDLRASELREIDGMLFRNPRMLTYMTDKQRNKLRDLLGEDTINTLIKLTE